MNNLIDIREIFSQNLRYYRKQVCLSQTKLGDVVNHTDKYLYLFLLVYSNHTKRLQFGIYLY